MFKKKLQNLINFASKMVKIGCFLLKLILLRQGSMIFYFYYFLNFQKICYKIMGAVLKFIIFIFIITLEMLKIYLKNQIIYYILILKKPIFKSYIRITHKILNKSI